jgi:carbohydrate kinase (thermoresistant glucokinase family)
VITCSALRRSYRARLLNGRPAAVLVFLEITREEAGARLAARSGHFFPASLLGSQLAALEAPQPDEDSALRTLTVRAGADPGAIVSAVMEWTSDFLP